MLQRNSNILAVGLAFAHLAMGGGFFLTIGNPVAANDPQAKKAVMVVRPDGCHEPAKAQLSGVAEGIVNGARRSVPLKLAALSKPGTYAVYREWPAEGVWVVNLTGKYLGGTTTAIVPMGPNGFQRESAKFLSRPATAADIEAALLTAK